MTWIGEPSECEAGFDLTPRSPEAGAEMARLRRHFAREDEHMTAIGLRSDPVADLTRLSVLEDAAAGRRVAIVSGDMRVYPSRVPEVISPEAHVQDNAKASD